jgi:hypothetical protein
MPKAAEVLTDNPISAPARGVVADDDAFLARVLRKVANDEALTKAELRAWKHWSDSTIDRYVARGLPVSRRSGVRGFFIPSRVNAWQRGELPALPPSKRGRPRSRRG